MSQVRKGTVGLVICTSSTILTGVSSEESGAELGLEWTEERMEKMETAVTQKNFKQFSWEIKQRNNVLTGAVILEHICILWGIIQSKGRK